MFGWCSGWCSGVFWWRSGGVLVKFWCSGGVLVFWWCSSVLVHGGVLVVFWCSSGVLVFQWCFSGVLNTRTPPPDRTPVLVFWWCSGWILVFWWCFGVLVFWWPILMCSDGPKWFPMLGIKLLHDRLTSNSLYRLFFYLQVNWTVLKMVPNDFPCSKTLGLTPKPCLKDVQKQSYRFGETWNILKNAYHSFFWGQWASCFSLDFGTLEHVFLDIFSQIFIWYHF